MPENKRQTQADRILELLQIYSKQFTPEWRWVDAIDLSRISLSFTRRIFELRQAGHIIELDDKWNNGKRRTRYRLASQQPAEVVSR